MFIDSHCHLDRLNLSQHQESLETALKAALDVGVDKCLSVSVDLSETPKIIQIAEQFPFVYASVGVHPTEVDESSDLLSVLTSFAAHPKVIAIGETGLDYYRVLAPEARAAQQLKFKTHIKAALLTQKPLIIHTREAASDTLEILTAENAAQVGGVFHCFTETWETAKSALDLGFYISFSGILTFKNAQALKEIAKKVPLDRILIETDAPYLAPVPYRGKSNEPAYVRYVAEALAEIRHCSVESIGKTTSDNFYRCFKISQD